MPTAALMPVPNKSSYMVHSFITTDTASHLAKADQRQVWLETLKIHRHIGRGRTQRGKNSTVRAARAIRDFVYGVRVVRLHQTSTVCVRSPSTDLR
ncbi:hypothetical protein PoB_005128200 [Plakobranchus ocellatus]|uniref:Uncharacterized protein n=1 Tax=Plakobranchus ocellatus TaxID=259542 RepID=A0AAV4BZK3_9GAST|nr:hypothetical protein PoB_005128200 [Plakobranchus ocellatus]